MSELRIRAAAFQRASDEVLALVSSGRLSQEDLQGRLEPGELALLDETAGSVNWYPVDTYDRLVTTLMELEGGGSNDYLVERGKRSVETLTVATLETRIEEARRNRSLVDHWSAPVGPILVALPSAIYSASDWTLAPGEDRGCFTIEVTDADEFPESLRHTVQGVLERLASRLIGSPVQVTSLRPLPDKLVFRGSPVQ